MECVLGNVIVWTFLMSVSFCFKCIFELSSNILVNKTYQISC